MSFVQRLTQWEGIVFGFIVGIAATVVGSMAYNEISGTLRVSHLRRSLHNNQLEEIATLMEQELAAATTASGVASHSRARQLVDWTTVMGRPVSSTCLRGQCA